MKKLFLLPLIIGINCLISPIFAEQKIPTCKSKDPTSCFREILASTACLNVIGEAVHNKSWKENMADSLLWYVLVMKKANLKEEDFRDGSIIKNSHLTAAAGQMDIMCRPQMRQQVIELQAKAFREGKEWKGGENSDISEIIDMMYLVRLTEFATHRMKWVNDPQTERSLWNFDLKE